MTVFAFTLAQIEHSPSISLNSVSLLHLPRSPILWTPWLLFLAFSMVEGSSRSKKSYYLENSQVGSFAHQVASFAHQARCFASETPITC